MADDGGQSLEDDLTETAAPSFDAARFRQVLGHFCSGITIVTAVHDGVPAGMTAQSFTSLSLDPPLVLFCPAKSSASWPKIRAAGSFCVNVLDQEQEAVSRTFATSGIDKFEGIGWRPGITGAPLIDGSLATIECRLEQEHDGGDHVIAVGRVVAVEVAEERGPLLFYRGGYGRFEN